MAKEADGKEFLLRKVSMTDTLRALPAGLPVRFDCREAGPLNTAQAAASRLNIRAGREIYKVTTTDNGATFTVTRQA